MDSVCVDLKLINAVRIETQTPWSQVQCINRSATHTIIFIIPIFLLSFGSDKQILSVTGTHELTSVVAGSALWLDCSTLVHPVGSLLQITWRKNADQIYKQYMVNEQHMGGYKIYTHITFVT